MSRMESIRGIRALRTVAVDEASASVAELEASLGDIPRWLMRQWTTAQFSTAAATNSLSWLQLPAGAAIDRGFIAIDSPFSGTGLPGTITASITCPLLSSDYTLSCAVPLITGDANAASAQITNASSTANVSVNAQVVVVGAGTAGADLTARVISVDSGTAFTLDTVVVTTVTPTNIYLGRIAGVNTYDGAAKTITNNWTAVSAVSVALTADVNLDTLGYDGQFTTALFVSLPRKALTNVSGSAAGGSEGGVVSP